LFGVGCFIGLIAQLLDLSYNVLGDKLLKIKTKLKNEKRKVGDL
jgi:hypothetical protein